MKQSKQIHNSTSHFTNTKKINIFHRLRHVNPTLTCMDTSREETFAIFGTIREDLFPRKFILTKKIRALDSRKSRNINQNHNAVGRGREKE